MISRYSAGLTQGWHRHDEAVVTLVLDGHVREHVRGHGAYVAGPMEVGVKPPHLPHADAFGPRPVRALRLAYDASELDRLESLAAGLREWRWSSDTAVVRAVLASRLDDMADAKHELLAALTGDRPRTGEAPAWLQRVRESVQDQFRTTISLATLAALHEAHPVYLARVFRRYYGESVGETLRRLRLHEALRRLASTDDPLASVAAGSGFADQSHMTRHVRAAFGTTPAVLRRTMRALPVRAVLDWP